MAALHDMSKKVVLNKLFFPDAPILTYNFTTQQNLTESPDMVVFTCTARSHPTSAILWNKDGSLYIKEFISVVNTAGFRRTVTKSSLAFPTGIKRTDYGRYSCNATNSLGSASFSTHIRVWCKLDSYTVTFFK